jgi:hypothetical protein
MAVGRDASRVVVLSEGPVLLELSFLHICHRVMEIRV